MQSRNGTVREIIAYIGICSWREIRRSDNFISMSCYEYMKMSCIHITVSVFWIDSKRVNLKRFKRCHGLFKTACLQALRHKFYHYWEYEEIFHCSVVYYSPSFFLPLPQPFLPGRKQLQFVRVIIYYGHQWKSG